LLVLGGLNINVCWATWETGIQDGGQRLTDERFTLINEF
jgi:hypothetical protein